MELEWITANWTELAAIITGIVTVFSLIANLTPTEADNKVVNAIIRVVNLMGLNIKKNL